MDTNKAISFIDRIRTISNEGPCSGNVETQQAVVSHFVELFNILPCSLQQQIKESIDRPKAGSTRPAQVKNPPVAHLLRNEANHASLPISLDTERVDTYLRKNQDRWIASAEGFFTKRTFDLLGGSVVLDRTWEERNAVEPIAFRLLSRELYRCRVTWGQRRKRDLLALLQEHVPELYPSIAGKYDKWMGCGGTFHIISQECDEVTLLVLPLGETSSGYQRLPKNLEHPECASIINSLQRQEFQNRGQQFEELHVALSKYVVDRFRPLRKPEPHLLYDLNGPPTDRPAFSRLNEGWQPPRPFDASRWALDDSHQELRIDLGSEKFPVDTGAALFTQDLTPISARQHLSSKDAFIEAMQECTAYSALTGSGEDRTLSLGEFWGTGVEYEGVERYAEDVTALFATFELPRKIPEQPVFSPWQAPVLHEQGQVTTTANVSAECLWAEPCDASKALAPYHSSPELRPYQLSITAFVNEGDLWANAPFVSS